MILNFPKNFDLKWLNDFDFGQADAKEDSLLSECLCITPAFDEFLSGKKDIVIGERGTGKSALFRLIKDGECGFYKKTASKNKAKKQILVPIDEELYYQATKEKIASLFNSATFDIETKYQFCWELFILLRVVSKLKSEFSSSEVISEIYNNLNNVFDIKNRVNSIFDVLSNTKKTIGVKIDNLQTGYATPNFYASIEPSLNSCGNDDKEIFLTVDEYKEKLNDFLAQHNSIVYVLIDKLDEFVVKEEYDTQKKALQSLLLCQRGYASYQNIKLRPFIRTDLFHKLDFEALGYDKVIAKTVELKWSPEDIRKFIARRVLYNLIACTKLSYLEIYVDEEKLSEKKPSLPDKHPKIAAIFRRFLVFRVIYKKFKHVHKNIKIKKQDTRDGRKINLNDALSRCLIKSIFPVSVDFKLHGATKRDDIFKYFESNFSLATGNTTPRITLMYIQKCIEYTIKYYKSNPDINQVALDSNNEYSLVVRDCMSNAYDDLKFDIWETFCNVSNKWRPFVEIIRSNKKKFLSKPLTYMDMKKLLSKSNMAENELHQLLAFLVHLGVLKCNNAKLDYDSRTYDLPILFK
jgi:hypothetical protein